MADFVLETPRLQLRRMALSDLDFITEMLTNREVMKHYPQQYDRADAVRWIERHLARYAQYGHGLWLALGKQEQAPVGQVGLGLHVVDGAPEPEIGYLIHQPYWRKGYASEAAAAVKEIAFGQFDKPRVISLIRPANIPSQRTAWKIGLKPEKLTVFEGLEHLVFSAARPTP